MGKTKKRFKQLMDERTNILDNYLLKMVISAIMFCGLIVKFTTLKGYMHFNMKQEMTGTNNIFTYYKLVFLSIVVLMLLFFFLYRIGTYKTKIRLDYIFIFYCIIIGTAFVATFFNPVGKAQIIGFYTRTHGLLAYIVLFTLLYILSNLNIENKNLLFLIYSINTLSIILVIIGCFQFFGHNIFEADWFRLFYLPNGGEGVETKSVITKYTAASLMAHFNYFGGYCSIFFPMMMVYAVKVTDLKNKILFSLGAVFLFIGVISSVSQGGLFVTLIMAIILPIILLNRKNIKIIVILYSIYIGILFAVYKFFNILTYRELGPTIKKYLSNPKYLIILLIVLLVYLGIIWSRKYFAKSKYKVMIIIAITAFAVFVFGFIYVLTNFTESHKGMFTNRGYAWYYTMEVLKKHFLFGYGPDNFFYAFPQENLDSKTFGMGVSFDKPHNMYLQIAMDIGTLGAIAFLSLLLIYILKTIKAMVSDFDDEKKIFLLATLVAIIAYMIQGIVNDNHLVIMPIIFTVWGIGIAVTRDIKLFRNKSNNLGSEKNRRKNSIK